MYLGVSLSVFYAFFILAFNVLLVEYRWCSLVKFCWCITNWYHLPMALGATVTSLKDKVIRALFNPYKSLTFSWMYKSLGRIDASIVDSHKCFRLVSKANIWFTNASVLSFPEWKIMVKTAARTNTGSQWLSNTCGLIGLTSVYWVPNRSLSVRNLGPLEFCALLHPRIEMLTMTTIINHIFTTSWW